MKDEKFVLASKTIQVNIAALVALGVILFGVEMDQDTQVKVTAGIMGAVNLASIIFRAVANSTLRF